MQAVAGLLGTDSVAGMHAGTILYGKFLAAVLYFVIVATVMFMIVRAAKRFQRAPVEETPVDSDEVVLLREIRDALRSRGV
jgi:large-conductance mechanosensitive channel